MFRGEITYRARLGAGVYEACVDAVVLKRITGCSVYLKFNDQMIKVQEDMDAYSLEKEYLKMVSRPE